MFPQEIKSIFKYNRKECIMLPCLPFTFQEEEKKMNSNLSSTIHKGESPLHLPFQGQLNYISYDQSYSKKDLHDFNVTQKWISQDPYSCKKLQLVNGEITIRKTQTPISPTKASHYRRRKGRRKKFHSRRSPGEVRYSIIR